jgi:hypothetical protein
VLGQDAGHRVEAVGERGGPPDAAAQNLVAADGNEPCALAVGLEDVRQLFDAERDPRDALHDQRPVRVLVRFGNFEAKLHDGTLCCSGGRACPSRR